MDIGNNFETTKEFAKAFVGLYSMDENSERDRVQWIDRALQEIITEKIKIKGINQ